MGLSRNETRKQIGEALKLSSRNVQKAVTVSNQKLALWDQTNSTLLAIAFELRCIAEDLEKRNG